MASALDVATKAAFRRSARAHFAKAGGGGGGSWGIKPPPPRAGVILSNKQSEHRTL